MVLNDMRTEIYKLKVKILKLKRDYDIIVKFSNFQIRKIESLEEENEKLKNERAKRIETRNVLIDIYNFYASRLDDFNCKLKKGECDLIYKVDAFIRARE